jgi:hypothetical protein
MSRYEKSFEIVFGVKCLVFIASLQKAGIFHSDFWDLINAPAKTESVALSLKGKVVVSVHATQT